MQHESDRWRLVSRLRDPMAVQFCAVILVIVALASWSQRDFISAFHAYTPLDRSPVANPHGWFVLANLRPYIPEDANVVVVGNSPAEHHDLYMMAVAILDHCMPRPVSYFGIEHPESLERATHLVTFRRQPPGGQGWREVYRLSDGALYER